jgi:hypothetical protein
MPGQYRTPIQITVFGDKVINREIISRGARAVEMTPVYEEIGWDLARIMREQFDTEGARSGDQWAPNEPATDARKAALGQPLKVFQATTELRESFKLWDDNNIYEATPEGLRWGSASEHGAFHQPDAKGRKVMVLTEADKVGIVERMHMYIVFGELR